MAAGRLFDLILRTAIAGIFLLHFNSCSSEKHYSKTIEISDPFFTGKLIVERVDKINKYRLTIFNSISGESDRIYTPYEIFHAEAADVDHDGKTDICIGIIKPTPFDSLVRKRLFIYRIDRNYIRPLWLSSRLVHPLEEFAVFRAKDGRRMIRTIEKHHKDLYCVSEYNWGSFGMKLSKEAEDSLSIEKARELFNNLN